MANTDLDNIDYDVRVCTIKNELRDLILAKNTVNGRPRMVAGYSQDWKGKKDPAIEDVRIQKHGFSARWNLDKDGGLWILQPGSVQEVGSTHTSQRAGARIRRRDCRTGLCRVRRAGRHQRADALIAGSFDPPRKGWLKRDPTPARVLANRVIRNSYRTLMTRSMQRCYLHSTDAETLEYFRAMSSGLEAASWLRAAEPLD